MQVDLPIDPEYVNGVNEDLARIAQAAAFLVEFPLDQSIEAAAVFEA